MRPSTLGRVFVCVIVFLILGSCSRSVAPTPAPRPPGRDAVVGAPLTNACNGIGGVLNLDCPAFPNTNPQQQPDWDYFAWNSFIAANWPAIDPATNNEQRGTPNTNLSFTGAASDTLTTWETFKEKREIFFYPPGPAPAPGPWNQAPVYGPLGETIPLCSGGTTSTQPRRFFGQGAKITLNTLDETVEVASEALETQAQLCAGVANPMCGTSGQADCCLVPNMPVGPRVWKGSPVKAVPQPVVYEVKVNYDFYNYVTNTATQYYLDSNADPAALANNIRLPYRTSTPNPPGGSNPNRVVNYDSSACADYYAGITPTGNQLPCVMGAVHLKAAWMLLQNEDPTKYHTADAAYFRTQTDGSTCMAYGTFGLIGLHIIQRIHQTTPVNPQPPGTPPTANNTGGTFVFATWEHVDNDSAGFTYSNYLPTAAGTHPAPGFYPITSNALPVTRQFPILPGTMAVNTAVHSAIAAQNPSSVWLNYQLIGTQFMPIDVSTPIGPGGNANDPTNIGQPLFLANSVIETNLGLQNFQGLPPNVTPTANFQKNGIVGNSSQTAFARSNANVSFGASPVNMGGCMGCHGVAQVKGFTFSFVFLIGQGGGDVDTQQNFTVPPLPPPSSP